MTIWAPRARDGPGYVPHLAGRQQATVLRDHTCLRTHLRKQDLEKLRTFSCSKASGQSSQPHSIFPYFLASALPPPLLLSPVPHHTLVTMASIHKSSLTAQPLARTHSLSPSSLSSLLLLTPQVWMGMPPPRSFPDCNLPTNA